MSAELPADLRRVLGQAEEALDASEPGELPLPERRRIWDELGQGPEDRGSPGHRRRTILDLIAVEHVKPLWDRAYPSDGTVQELLDAARQVLDGRQPAEWADELHSRRWVEITDRMGEDHQFVAGYVGTAACCALSTAAHDKSYANLPADTDDYEIDSEDWDTSFLAAMAAAGGEVGDPHASEARRREFWQWYLREAVPAA